MKNKKRYYKVPKIIFWSVKFNNILTVVLNSLVFVISIYIFFCGRAFTTEVLKNLSEFCMTVILSVVGLGISVLQTDKTIIKGNTNENKEELYKRYIFNFFPTIIAAILGYLIAILFPEYHFIIHAYSACLVIMTIKQISGTATTFIAFLNIKD